MAAIKLMADVLIAVIVARIVLIIYSVLFIMPRVLKQVYIQLTGLSIGSIPKILGLVLYKLPKNCLKIPLNWIYFRFDPDWFVFPAAGTDASGSCFFHHPEDMQCQLHGQTYFGIVQVGSGQGRNPLHPVD